MAKPSDVESGGFFFVESHSSSGYRPIVNSVLYQSRYRFAESYFSISAEQRAARWSVEWVVRKPKVEPSIESYCQFVPAASANPRGIHLAS